MRHYLGKSTLKGLESELSASLRRQMDEGLLGMRLQIYDALFEFANC